MKGKKRMWAAALSAVMVCGPSAAQDKVEGALSADFVSQYVWRGQRCGSFSAQPSASLSWKGLNLGAWGSFAVTPADKYEGTDEELDVTLSYSAGGFSAGLTDYYFFNCGHPFFKYGGLDRSAHTFEASAGYDFGPLSVTWSTVFAGQDGLTGGGDRAFSSYAQVDVPFRLGGLDWTGTLGAVPYSTTLYTSDRSGGFHVNQVSLRAQRGIKLARLTLPLFAQLTANPSSGDMHYFVGLTLKAL